MNKARDFVLAFWFSTGEDWLKTYDAFRDKKPIDVDAALEGIDRGAYVTIVDADYPERCKSLSRPPFVLGRETAERLASETSDSGSDGETESED